MIIVVMHTPQNDQIQLVGEGGDAEAMKTLLAKAIEAIEAQQAKANGQRPSGLVVPPTMLPRNIRGDQPQ